MNYDVQLSESPTGIVALVPALGISVPVSSRAEARDEVVDAIAGMFDADRRSIGVRITIALTGPRKYRSA